MANADKNAGRRFAGFAVQFEAPIKTQQQRVSMNPNAKSGTFAYVKHVKMPSISTPKFYGKVDLRFLPIITLILVTLYTTSYFILGWASHPLYVTLRREN